MKPLRIMVILALLTAGACDLYFTQDRSGRHGPGAPDAAINHHDGGGFIPDAYVGYDGGPLPDAYLSYDGGGCCGLPDAAIIVVDAGSAPDCHGP